MKKLISIRISLMKKAFYLILVFASFLGYSQKDTLSYLQDQQGGLWFESRFNAIIDLYNEIQGDTLDKAFLDSLIVSNVQSDTIKLLGGTGTQGVMRWNSDEETVDLIENGTTLQIGQEVHYHVRNNSGSTISNGVPVMSNGTIGNSGRIAIDLMNGTSPLNDRYFLGVTTEEILNDEDGKVTYFGKVRGIQTDGGNYGESWSDGDLIYISPSIIGELTNIAPAAPLLSLPVGLVIQAHQSNGTLFVMHRTHDENKYILASGDIGMIDTLSMGSNRITEVANPLEEQDASTKNYTDFNYLQSYTLESLPDANGPPRMIYVSDANPPSLAYNDGVNWRYSHNQDIASNYQTYVDMLAAVSGIDQGFMTLKSTSGEGGLYADNDDTLDSLITDNTQQVRWWKGFGNNQWSVPNLEISAFIDPSTENSYWYSDQTNYPTIVDGGAGDVSVHIINGSALEFTTNPGSISPVVTRPFDLVYVFTPYSGENQEKTGVLKLTDIDGEWVFKWRNSSDVVPSPAINDTLFYRSIVRFTVDASGNWEWRFDDLDKITPDASGTGYNPSETEFGFGGNGHPADHYVYAALMNFQLGGFDSNSIDSIQTALDNIWPSGPPSWPHVEGGGYLLSFNTSTNVWSVPDEGTFGGGNSIEGAHTYKWYWAISKDSTGADRDKIDFMYEIAGQTGATLDRDDIRQIYLDNKITYNDVQDGTGRKLWVKRIKIPVDSQGTQGQPIVTTYTADDQTGTPDNPISDTFAPYVTYVDTLNIAETSGDTRYNTGEGNGTLYSVTTTSLTAPTATQVKAGQNHLGASATHSGSQSISSSGTYTYSSTGLSSETTYYTYSVHTDLAGNDSDVISASFTTGTPPVVAYLNFTQTQVVADDPLSRTWNDVTDADGSVDASTTYIANINDEDGNPTGWVLTTDSVNVASAAGGSGCSGSVYGDDAGQSQWRITSTGRYVSFNITGLDNTKTYSFDVMACRSGAYTDYHFYGATNVSIDDVLNTSPTVYSTGSSIAPSGGTIHLLVEVGASGTQGAIASLVITENP